MKKISLIVFSLLFLCGCFRVGGNRDMRREDLPESVSKAIDILLNYEEHTIDELIKAQKILEEYERPKFLEGFGVTTDSLNDKDRSFVDMEYRFEKLGIIVHHYCEEGLETKVTVEKIEKNSNKK